MAGAADGLTCPAGVGAARPSRPAQGLALVASLLAIPHAFLLGDAVATVVTGSDSGATGLTGWPLWSALFAAGAARSLADAGATFLAAANGIAARQALRASWLAAFARWSPMAGARAARGDVATMLVDRLDALDPWFVRYPLARLRVAVVPAAILLAILPVSWMVALLLAAAGPVVPVFMALIGARAHELGRRQLDQAGSLTALLLDRVAGLATIRALGAGARVGEEIAARGDALRAETMRVLAVAFLSSAALEFFASIGVALAAVFIGFHLLGFFGFGGTFGLAGGVAMLALAPDYFQPLRDFAAAYHDRANALALDDRAAGTFLPEIARMSMPRARKATDGPPPAIRVRDLTVRLPGQTCPVLDGVALDVPAGGLAAVAGPSGIGKSLLVACVGGLVEDMAGTATVGGRTADDAARPALCWLGQEPLIRHGSVLANLSPDGRPVAHDAAWRALAEVGLAPVVARMPRGLLTPLGETGAGLSRGELRRVAVARALLDPAPVLLADEPTADLDADSAAIVRRVLAGMAGARTVLVATHDDDLAAMAGHVLRLGGVR